MSETTSDTPRTNQHYLETSGGIEDLRFARSLERDLTEAIKCAAGWMAYAEHLETCVRCAEDSDCETGKTLKEIAASAKGVLPVSGERLLEVLEEMIPARNCSCHISAPCHQCVEWGAAFEAVKNYRERVAGGITMKTVQEIATALGIDSNKMDKILFDVKINQGRLNLCEKPHDFSIVLNRRTGEPIENPTAEDLIFIRRSCSKCGGTVNSTNSNWYNRGLADGSKNTELESLIAHCCVHSGYLQCGYLQMDTDKKRLYCRVIGARFTPLAPEFDSSETQGWFCDWCNKGMPESFKGVSDDRGHMHCSQECVDNHQANR